MNESGPTNNKSVLLMLVERFKKDPTEDNLTSLSYCLKECSLFVPVLLVKEETGFSLDPLVLAKGEITCIPVYTQKNVARIDNSTYYKIASLTFEQIVGLCQKVAGLNGIVIDPSTIEFVIPINMFDLILSLTRVED